jgi:shikimate dehydrogenase
MANYGLIGFPLANTFSVNYFGGFFAMNELSHSYKNYAISHLESLYDLITREHLSGINVTIPHKLHILDYLTALSDEAKEIGAVNCVKIVLADEQPLLKGFNTDVYGFRQSLLPLLQPWHQQALVLGTGGASLAVQFVLKQLGISYVCVSRNQPDALHYEDIDKAVIRSHQLIINCTPVGMHPASHKVPQIPYEFMTDLHIAYDLIYLPKETLFIQQSKEKGATVKNGLEMLHLQAQKSWEIWNDDTI